MAHDGCPRSLIGTYGVVLRRILGERAFSFSSFGFCGRSDGIVRACGLSSPPPFSYFLSVWTGRVSPKYHRVTTSLKLSSRSPSKLNQLRTPPTPDFSTLPEISEEQHAGNACWRSKASQVLGVRQDEAVVHDFSAYDTHVYPVAMYPALRAHVRATEAVTRGSEGSLADVMSTGVCEGGGGSSGGGAVVVGGGKEEVGKRRWFRREMQYNLMASFMW